jgi:hypothetical protein
MQRQTGFIRDASASVAVQAAMLLLLVLGFIALGVEISQLLLEQRKQQLVADSAAMAAASATLLGVSDLQSEARAVAAQLGYRNGVNDVTVSAARPPTTGAHANDSKYVEVKVERVLTPALIQLFRVGTFTVKARAVAVAGTSSIACVLTLGTSGTAIDMSQNSSLTMSGCGVATNSTSNSSVNMANNATINGSVTTAGDVAMSNGASVTGSVTKQATAIADPYASVVLPTGSPTYSSTPAGIIPHGVYTNGWNLSGPRTLEQGGTFFVRSQWKMSNNASLIGTNVTIIIDGSYKIDIGNNVTLTLSAPTSGNLSGIAIYSGSSTNQTQTVSNNGTLNITGALYFPHQTVDLQNNTTTTGTSCTQIVAKKLLLDNNAAMTLKPSCTGAGTTQIGSTTNASLAE